MRSCLLPATYHVKRKLTFMMLLSSFDEHSECHTVQTTAPIHTIALYFIHSQSHNKRLLAQHLLLHLHHFYRCLHGEV